MSERAARTTDTARADAAGSPAPAEQIPDTQTPDEQTATGQTPDEQAQQEQSTAAQNPTEQGSADQTPGGRSPAGQLSVDEALTEQEPPQQDRGEAPAASRSAAAVSAAESGAEPSSAPSRGAATRRSGPRTRTPKQDPVLTEAVDLAREAVVAGAHEGGGIGEHVGVTVHEDRLLTHLFDCTLPGYPGWTWYATVSRAPRSKHVSVCESGLLAGPRSLLAPAWIPWEERMNSLHAEQEGAEHEGTEQPSPEQAETDRPDDAAREPHEGSAAGDPPAAQDTMSAEGGTSS
ncbi:DUF3027 domain-containing protein [Kocuria rhizophila]|uniref:DUF3027 domain-containing protein n=1 Tax=Kocuria rhizophila TaxID=72000 RepID=A0AAX2SFC0_KOCRH|nr:DUF3027 domain-containing protein [Kocuria rhizophila]TFI02343.1 DUF3027 domain-containing protein [Kocuria rhizophila]TFI09917.1 DUF3027 domain-containing protein [Kocuria rhizophila]